MLHITTTFVFLLVSSFLSAMQSEKILKAFCPVVRKASFQGYNFFVVMPDCEHPHHLSLPMHQDAQFLFVYALFQDNRQVCSLIDAVQHVDLFDLRVDDLLARAMGFIEMHQKPENKLVSLQCITVAPGKKTRQLHNLCARIKSNLPNHHIDSKHFPYCNKEIPTTFVVICRNLHESYFFMNTPYGQESYFFNPYLNSLSEEQI